MSKRKRDDLSEDESSKDSGAPKLVRTCAFRGERAFSQIDTEDTVVDDENSDAASMIAINDEGDIENSLADEVGAIAVAALIRETTDGESTLSTIVLNSQLSGLTQDSQLLGGTQESNING